jgi:GNAT superfamily N-acetyltransferase
MGIEPFRSEDMERFLLLSAREGWICDSRELEFLISSFPKGCLVWREEGETIGFVTAIRYASSGWIGNLIVAQEWRGKGIGRSLLREALSSLILDGASTVWLTASASGEPIYAAAGFKGIDAICRWRGEVPVNATTPEPVLIKGLHNIDRAGWGDDREKIFGALKGRSIIFDRGESFLYLQDYPDGTQVGPWGAYSRKSASEVMLQAFSGKGKTRKIFLDVPEQNFHAATILADNGFLVTASSRLMYMGETPSYHPLFIYALASMGSFG